jgi:hypothetical protein
MLFRTTLAVLLLLGLANAFVKDATFFVKAKEVDSLTVQLYAAPDTLCSVYSVRDWKIKRGNRDSIVAKIICGKEDEAFFWLYPVSADYRLFGISGSTLRERRQIAREAEKKKQQEKSFVSDLIGVGAVFLLVFPFVMDLKHSAFE